MNLIVSAAIILLNKVGQGQPNSFLKKPFFPFASRS